ncbi:MAG: hypothetical protein KIT87_20395 [Anaerolineae bacterium]|nr:hypothetical protein [Anaerolineae bacterium]
MEQSDNGRRLTDYPGVVIAYFEKPDALQAALAELRGLGLQDGDIHILTEASTTSGGEPPPTPGLFQRLASLFGQGRPVAPSRPATVTPGQTVVVVQASRLPGVPVVDILEQHGASKVETRDMVHTALRRANE